MPLSAATATAQPVVWLALTAGLLGWAVFYLAACTWWPFKACPRCTGSGKKRSPSGKAWRPCRRCKGSGARLRAGRRAVNWIRSRRP